MYRYLLIALLLLTGCAQLPPPPGDAAAKRFEAVPDRAVIYVLRHIHDRNFVAPIKLDDQGIGATYRATFMRLVIPAGRHQITGVAGDSGRISLQTEAGKIYYVNQTTWGYDSLSNSKFDLVDEQYGRSTALAGTLTNEVVQ